MQPNAPRVPEEDVADSEDAPDVDDAEDAVDAVDAERVEGDADAATDPDAGDVGAVDGFPSHDEDLFDGPAACDLDVGPVMDATLHLDELLASGRDLDDPEFEIAHVAVSQEAFAATQADFDVGDPVKRDAVAAAFATMERYVAKKNAAERLDALAADFACVVADAAAAARDRAAASALVASVGIALGRAVRGVEDELARRALIASVEDLLLSAVARDVAADACAAEASAGGRPPAPVRSSARVAARESRKMMPPGGGDVAPPARAAREKRAATASAEAPGTRAAKNRRTATGKARAAKK